MDTPTFNPMDLIAREAHFELTKFPGEKFTICAWTVFVKLWAEEKYTNEGVMNIMSEVKQKEICEIAYFMLVDKTKFPTIDDFTKSLLSMRDVTAIYIALNESVGHGEPILEPIRRAMNGGQPPKAQAPKKQKKTGA